MERKIKCLFLKIRKRIEMKISLWLKFIVYVLGKCVKMVLLLGWGCFGLWDVSKFVSL